MDMKCYGWKEVGSENIIYPIAPDNPKHKFDDMSVYSKALECINGLNSMVGYDKYEVVELDQD